VNAAGAALALRLIREIIIEMLLSKVGQAKLVKSLQIAHPQIS
jgi:hypothetical protein